MKILLLGKSGMLGSCFLDFFVGMLGLNLHAYGRAEFDICDTKKMREKFLEIKPDLVINCTAYTAVDDAEKNRDLAFKINAEAVGEMAKLCKEIDAVLIHFSTDYVFDGTKKEGYAESDETRAINVYGESKLAGEKLIAANMEKYLIVRTAWLFGKNGKNFVDTMLRLGEAAIQNGTELKVVNDQIGSPTYTHDLVNAVIENFVEPLEDGKSVPFGIYHLTNSDVCSWFDFAKKIFEIKKMELRVLPITTEQFPRPAKRPSYSILLNKKLPLMRPWGEALATYLE